MSTSTAVAVFFLIWWVVLFAVLPWGIRSQHEGDKVTPGTDPGAPTVPKLGRKLVWTTVVASVIFAACYVVYSDHLISLDSLMTRFGPPDLQENSH
jgi:predicted secreted protein